MKNYKSSLLIVCLVLASTTYSYAGSVTLTTYYPAPTGNYDQMTANNVGIGTVAPTSGISLSVSNKTTSTDLRIDSSALNRNADLSFGKLGGQQWKISSRNELDAPNNRLAFLDNTGFERMTLSPEGNLGIGTINPSAYLDIKDTGLGEYYLRVGNLLAVRNYLTRGQLFLGYTDITNPTYQKIVLNTNGDSYIDTGSNVGIGTFTPQALLDIQSRTAGIDALRIGHSSSNTVINFAPAALTDALIDNDAIGSRTILRTSNGAPADVNALAIRANGNVGIGTVTPNLKLDVRGNEAIYSIAAVDNAEGVNLFNPGGAIASAGYNLHAGAAGAIPSAATLKGYLRLDTATNDMYLGTHDGATDNPSMYFKNADGFIGIGEPDPLTPFVVRRDNATPQNLATATYNTVATFSNGESTDFDKKDVTLYFRLNGFPSFNVFGIRRDIADGTGAAADWFFTGKFGATASEIMTLKAGGNVGIGITNPNFKLEINGDLQANGFYYPSDVTLKENIVTISNPIGKVQQLRGVMFEWKDTKKKSSGVIAQEVEQILPELVHTTKDGLKSVEYGNLVGLLIEAIKEQQQEIENLKLGIKSLREKNELENRPL